MSFILPLVAAGGLQRAPAACKNRDFDKLLVGGVLRPQLFQALVDSGVACAGSGHHPGTACLSLSLLPLL